MRGNYPYGRLPMAADSSKFYFANEGQIGSVNTSTGAITYCDQCENLSAGGYDAVLDANGTSLYADGLLLDNLMNVQGFQTLNVREGFDASYVYGANLSPDGALLFQPGTQAIDVVRWPHRRPFARGFRCPVPLSQNYRAWWATAKAQRAGRHHGRVQQQWHRCDRSELAPGAARFTLSHHPRGWGCRATKSGTTCVRQRPCSDRRKH